MFSLFEIVFRIPLNNDKEEEPFFVIPLDISFKIYPFFLSLKKCQLGNCTNTTQMTIITNLNTIALTLDIKSIAFIIY